MKAYKTDWGYEIHMETGETYLHERGTAGLTQTRRGPLLPAGAVEVHYTELPRSILRDLKILACGDEELVECPSCLGSGLAYPATLMQSPERCEEEEICEHCNSHGLVTVEDADDLNEAEWRRRDIRDAIDRANARKFGGF